MASWQKWQAKEDELSARSSTPARSVDKVTYTSRDLLSIAALTSSLNVDGHRADLVILKAARAQAAFDGRIASPTGILPWPPSWPCRTA